MKVVSALLGSLLSVVPPPPTRPASHPAPDPGPAPALVAPPDVPAVVATDPRAALADALARLPPTPTLAEVQTAALAEAGIDIRAATRWRSRARRAAVLPSVSVGYDRRFDRGWSLDQTVGTADALRNDAGNQDLLRAKATWELDRLVFTADELQAARAALDVADARERLLVEVTRLYFERQRLLLTRALLPAEDLDGALAVELGLREVEGLLTGLTGLDFTPPEATQVPPPDRGRRRPAARRELPPRRGPG